MNSSEDAFFMCVLNTIPQGRLAVLRSNLISKTIALSTITCNNSECYYKSLPADYYLLIKNLPDFVSRIGTL